MALALSLVGCGSDGSSSSTSAQSSALASTATEPFITNGVPETMVQVGTQYRYQTSATNPWGLPLSYNVVNKPDWAVFNATTGELSGTPQESDLGMSGNIEIAVSDGTTIATVGPFRIRVIPELHTTSAPTALTISGTPPSNVTVGEQYRFLPVVASAVDEPLSFSIINCPAWATFDTATGLLVGSPKSDNVGTFSNIVISVSAAGAPVSLAPFTIQVQAAGSGAPTISGSPQTTVSSGGNYSFTPTVSDPSGNALTFSIVNAPAWAGFNASTGELSGVAPSTSSAQLYANIVISVTDGSNSASLAPFSIEVEGSGGGGSHNIKFHPGYYLELDQNQSLTTNLSTIANLRGKPGVTGVELIMSWNQMEFAEGVYTSGSGANAQGFAEVDQLLSACADAGLQLILGYEDRTFGRDVPAGFNEGPSFLPSYLMTIENGSPGFLQAPAGTTFQGLGLQAVADVLNPAVWAREIALGRAYLSRYDSNPNFEMFFTPETANAAWTETSSYDAYVANYAQWMPAMRAAGPHTAIRISSNFMNTSAEWTTMFANAAQSNIVMGGPDATVESAPVYTGNARLTYDGYLGGEDWRSRIIWVAENQGSDIPAADGISYLNTLYNFYFTGPLDAGGSMKPSYWIIQQFNNNAQFTIPNITAWMATADALNTTVPAGY
ncbi:MAG TPA: putative Ig domain-containing protein [Steroidobacteraceae bacterium]